MSLIDICYEQIKDNFWYGLFGDFKLIIDKETGYFNATKLCASGGKHFYHWTATNHSKEICRYLASNVIPWDAKNPYMKEVTGGECDVIRGTYVCDDLILAISTWISPEFYLKCNKIIKDYFRRDFAKLKLDNVKFQNQLEEVEEKMGKLELENTKLKPIAAPYTKRLELHNVFAVVNISDERYEYYAIRTQVRNFIRAVRLVKNRYPDCEIVYKRIDPNSVKLFALMVEELDISSSGNYFNTGMTENDLLESIDDLYENILKN